MNLKNGENKSFSRHKILKICKYENKSENFFVIKIGVKKMRRKFLIFLKWGEFFFFG